MKGRHDALYAGYSILMKRTKKDLVEAIALLRNEVDTCGKDLPRLRAEVARLNRMVEHKDKVIDTKSELIEEWREKFETLALVFDAPKSITEKNFDEWVDHGERYGWFNTNEVIKRAQHTLKGMEQFRHLTKLDPEHLSDRGFKELVFNTVKQLLRDYPDITKTKEVSDWMYRHRTRIVKAAEGS